VTDEESFVTSGIRPN